MLFQLHQYTKKALQQWIHKFLLICYSAHLQIDVHYSNHLKKNNLFKPSIKIIQVLFFFSFFYFISPYSLSSSQAQFSHQLPSLLSSSHLSHQLSSPSSSRRRRCPSPLSSPSPRRRRRRRHPMPSQPTLSRLIHFRSVLSLLLQ